MKLPKGFNEFETVSPNHAIEPDKLSDELFLGYGIEEKYDGSHYQARFWLEPAGDMCGVHFASRRISATTGKPVDKTSNLPHLFWGPKELHGTLLLGEIVHRDRGFKNVIAVMGAKPEKAIARQKESGFLIYIIFDCPFYQGKDIRSKPLYFRRKYAETAGVIWRQYLLQQIQPSNFGKGNILFSFHRFTSTVATTKQLKLAYREIVREGGEGLMLKCLDAPYGKGVTKCKKAADVSVVVIDKTKGLGKFKGLLGAITFGVYCYNGLHKPKKLVEIGQASGMDDETRAELSRNFHEYVGKVIDVRCQFPDEPDKFDVTEDRLRHPRFLRLRPDLSAHQCTSEKLLSDFRRMLR